MESLQKEIEAKKLTMNFQSFSKHMEEIFNGLNVQQKNNFLDIHKKKIIPSTEQIETTFKINSSPKHLLPLNERMAQFLQRHEEKIKEQQEEKKSHELDDCTFHPQVKNFKKSQKLIQNLLSRQLMKNVPLQKEEKDNEANQFDYQNGENHSQDS